MGVQGFPTLKVVRPSAKKGGKPMVEDYQGARTAKAIADAVVEKIPNHVKRVTDKSIDVWLKESNETAKAVLFSDKGTTSALLRAIAIDFLGSIAVGQIRDKEKKAVETFGVEKYPTFILLPGGDKEAIVYDGELKKDAMVTFLSQITSPNPDPAPEKPKAKKEAKKSAEASKASDKSETEPSGADEKSTESVKPKPSVQPVIIPALATEAEVREKCLTSTSKICALVLLPSSGDGDADTTKAIRQVYEKHSRRKAAFPFYVVEQANSFSATLKDAVGLKDTSGIQLIAVNAKRGWYRTFPGKSYTVDTVEDWIDTIRMNEGKKESLPEGLVTEPTEDPEAEPKVEPVKKASKEAKKEEEAVNESKRKERDEL
jgi:protein disulfide-isomerase A6